MKEVEGRCSGSIRSQIIWTFGLLFLLETLVFGILSGNLLELSISGTNEKYMTEFVSHLLRVTDNYISNLEDISEVVTHFPEIREFLDNSSPSDRKSISSILYSVKTSRSDITSIILINKEGELLSDSTADSFNMNRNFKEENWYKALNNQSSRPFFLTASHVQTLIDKEYPWVISLFRKVGSGYIFIVNDMGGDGLSSTNRLDIQRPQGGKFDLLWTKASDGNRSDMDKRAASVGGYS